MIAIKNHGMKLHRIIPLIGLGVTALAATALPAQASSHREAPFITENPKVDATDVFMFRSYETGRENWVTLIADYLPFQDSYGGPNYFALDPNALYEFHIDNDGDAEEDITFQFRFETELKELAVPAGTDGEGNTVEVDVPLINIGGIGPGAADTGNLNRIETYTVNVVRGDRRADFEAGQLLSNISGGATEFVKPVDNIGQKSIADYVTYADNHIYTVNIPGCTVSGDATTQGKLFVGQRNEPFQINLGETFDLVNIAMPAGTANRDIEVDDLADKNITTLALEVPIACLTDGDPVIGGWTSASLRQARLLDPTPSFDRPALEGGAWTQVSRLGSPLVNEVVIGLKDKNLFNSSEPKDDLANFGTYVTNPTLPELLEILFPGVLVAPNNFPRNDLVAAFVTGLAGVNQPLAITDGSGTPGEMLRLNTSIPVTPIGSQENLGALAGDNAGFPNGRRPGDDVVDIELRVAMGVLCHAFPGAFGCGAADAPSGLVELTDGVLTDESDFGTAFPYLTTPIPGSVVP